MRTTLLVIGDLTMDGAKEEPSISKFIRHRKKLTERNVDSEFITYDDLLLGKLPDISTEKLKIMLFFPFSHWNNSIERYDVDSRIYGDEKFGNDYKRFFFFVSKIIEGKYKEKNITYVNPPQACILDRDKKRTTRLLKKRGISTPRAYKITNLAQFYKILNKIGALYVKPVFGAMGKGMTFVTKEGCWTNFIFRNNKIISRPYDYDWKFVSVSRKKRDAFLSILIKKKFVFEKAIKFPVVKRRKFDFRVYVVYGKTPYLYAKSAPRKKFITNWSQGGRIENPNFLKKFLPKRKINEIRRIAKEGSKAMGLNYAGVDVMMDEESHKLYFSEAHSFPAYERGFNLMKCVIEKI